MNANCSRKGACGRRSAALTVRRCGSTSRSTSALWQAVFASGAFGVAAQCPLHRLLAPKFADNEDQVLSMSMPKLCDDARGLPRADPWGKDCVKSGLRFLTPHKSPIRERLG